METKGISPRIRKKAKRLGASIYFEDESGIRSDFHSGTTWALRGHTPVIHVTGARFSLNMIGAINPRGELRFMVVKGSVASEQICDFLRRIMHNIENPIFLIWDGHPIHRSKKVKECINSFKGQLEVYTLRSYSPELNTSEKVWNNSKNQGVGRKKVFSPDQLKSLVLRQLRRLQKLPSIVIVFFRHPDCRYVLA